MPVAPNVISKITTVRRIPSSSRRLSNSAATFCGRNTGCFRTVRRRGAMKRAFTIVLLIAATGGGLAASARHGTVARFSARSVEMTNPARLSFRHVDIFVSQWSTDQDHRLLARTLLEKGPASFVDVLCGYPSLGTINVAGGRMFTIRYAWQTTDRDGGQRVYLASDEPISLTSG